MQFNIKPTDGKIVETLEENRGKLLSILGVAGAGIARDANNHIVGVAIHLDDEIANSKEIPSRLGEFKVYIKRFEEASDFENLRLFLWYVYFKEGKRAISILLRANLTVQFVRFLSVMKEQISIFNLMQI